MFKIGHCGHWSVKKWSAWKDCLMFQLAVGLERECPLYCNIRIIVWNKQGVKEEIKEKQLGKRMGYNILFRNMNDFSKYSIAFCMTVINKVLLRHTIKPDGLLVRLKLVGWLLNYILHRLLLSAKYFYLITNHVMHWCIKATAKSQCKVCWTVMHMDQLMQFKLNHYNVINMQCHQ